MQQLVDNRYRLIKPLGSGGMADVHLAHDNILDRGVALKVMSTRYASDEEFVERFKAEALQAAHKRGVIHRDIKPHNILITESGDVKVTDFGIARAASSSTMTRTGSILGTAHYISPEQAMGEPVGPSSDLYSLGVVLYEMLTGELPYDADTPLGIAMKHVNGYLVPPNQLNPDVPEGINAITVRLLEKNLADRYAD